MALNDLGRMLQDCAEWVARIVLYNHALCFIMKSSQGPGCLAGQQYIKHSYTTKEYSKC